jgi:hypothetical protein
VIGVELAGGLAELVMRCADEQVDAGAVAVDGDHQRRGAGGVVELSRSEAVSPWCCGGEGPL